MSNKKNKPRQISQDPKDPQFYNNPYPFYARLHAMNGPVFWEEYGFWCLSDFDLINTVLKDKRFARLPPANCTQNSYASHLNDFADSEKFSLLALEPPDHTRLRQKLNRAFVNRQVQQMAAEIEQLAIKRISSFKDNGEVELLSAYASTIPVTVIARLLGVPDNYCDSLLSWSHKMVRVYTMTQSKEDEIAANDAAKEFQLLIKDIIKQRRHQPGDDLISHLVSTDKSGDKLSDQEVCCLSILLLNAGHEATVHQIGNAVYALLKTAQNDTTNDQWSGQQPNQLQDRWQDQWMHYPVLADAVVEEALRYDAPLHLFTRYAQEDVVLSPDIELKQGEQLALLLGAANRDPKRFSNADQFDPARSDVASVSLGAGIHFCVGAALAKLELRIALMTLFTHLPKLELADEPQYQNSFHFHGLQALHLKW